MKYDSFIDINSCTGDEELFLCIVRIPCTGTVSLNDKNIDHCWDLPNLIKLGNFPSPLSRGGVGENNGQTIFWMAYI